MGSQEVTGIGEGIDNSRVEEVQRAAWNEYSDLTRAELKEEARKLWVEQERKLRKERGEDSEAQEEKIAEDYEPWVLSIRRETAMSLYYLKRNTGPEDSLPSWETIIGEASSTEQK